MDHTQNAVKNRSTDRKLMLRPIEGKAALKSDLSQTDPRLFTGENCLHAKMKPEGMWYLQYERGGVAPQLQQHFTSFNRLMTFVTDYFQRRNIEIVEVQDVW